MYVNVMIARHVTTATSNMTMIVIYFNVAGIIYIKNTFIIV